MPIKILYRIISKLAVWLTPITLILFSIVLNLPNAQLHKNTLKQSDFYSKLSVELQGNEIKEENLKNNGFSYLLTITVLKDLATPGWLQNLAEQNIDLSTKWLNNETEDISFYLPSKEIELAASNQIDQQTAEIGSKFASKIETCTEAQSETIKREGFALNKSLCLPEDVKNGKQKLTDFMGLSGSQKQNNFLDQLVRNNPISSYANNNFKISDLPDFKNPRKQIFDYLNKSREGFQVIKAYIPYLLVFCLLLLISEILLAKYSDKKMLAEFRRFLMFSAMGVFALGAAVILTLGGTAYFTSTIQNILLPGIGSLRLVNLISLEVVKFSFNLVSSAFWIAVGMIIFNLLLLLAERNDVFSNVENKNNKLRFKPETHSSFVNPTLDGQFKKTVYENTKNIANQPLNENKQNFTLDPRFYKVESEKSNFDTENFQEQNQFTVDFQSVSQNNYSQENDNFQTEPEYNFDQQPEESNLNRPDPNSPGFNGGEIKRQKPEISKKSDSNSSMMPGL